MFERREISDEYFMRSVGHLKRRRVKPTPRELARYFDCSLDMVREKIRDLRTRGIIRNEQSETVDYTVVDNVHGAQDIRESRKDDKG